MRLRNYFIIGAICVIIFTTWSIVSAFTYESEMNPLTFNNWKLIAVTGDQASPLKFFHLRTNPDLTSNITKVLVKCQIFPNGLYITGYAFYKLGKLFAYEITKESLHIGSWHYGRFFPDKDEKDKIDKMIKDLTLQSHKGVWRTT